MTRFRLRLPMMVALSTLTVFMFFGVDNAIAGQGQSSAIGQVLALLEKLQKTVDKELSKVTLYKFTDHTVVCTSDHDFLIHVNAFLSAETQIFISADGGGWGLNPEQGIELRSFTLGGAGNHTTRIDYVSATKPSFTNPTIVTLQTAQDAVASCTGS